MNQQHQELILSKHPVIVKHPLKQIHCLVSGGVYNPAVMEQVVIMCPGCGNELGLIEQLCILWKHERGPVYMAFFG